MGFILEPFRGNRGLPLRFLRISLLLLLWVRVLPAQQANLPDMPPDHSRNVAREPLADPARGSGDKVPAKLPAILAPQGTLERLTFHDKFDLYWHQAGNPLGFALPMFTTGFRMAKPLKGYPHEWSAGAGAVARLYGDGLARRQSQEAAVFLAGAAAHEDLRYWPSEKRSLVRRVTHALAFTVVDKSDSGRNMPALSNFAGAAASGFVGEAYLPRGFDDLTHAGQRSAVSFGLLGAWNLVNEFCPEWRPAMEKLHIPFVHPPCAK